MYRVHMYYVSEINVRTPVATIHTYTFVGFHETINVLQTHACATFEAVNIYFYRI